MAIAPATCSSYSIERTPLVIRRHVLVISFDVHCDDREKGEMTGAWGGATIMSGDAMDGASER